MRKAMIRHLALAICLVFFMCADLASAAPAVSIPMDESGFTAFLAQAFRKAQPDAVVTVEGPLLLKTQGKDNSWTTSLANIYSYCQRHKDDCAARAALFVIELSEAHEDNLKPVTRSDLRIVVRIASYVDAIKKKMGDDDEPVAEPICGDLWTLGVVDRPTTIRYLHDKDLKALDLSPDEILALAKANTKSAVASLIPNPATLKKRDLAVLMGDPVTASFAFPELWAPVAKSFGGTLIVAVPSTEELLLVGDDAPQALKMLQQASNDEWAQAMRPLSRRLYRWTEKGWAAVSFPAR